MTGLAEWKIEEWSNVDGGSDFIVKRRNTDTRWSTSASFPNYNDAVAYVSRQTFVPELKATHAFRNRDDLLADASIPTLEIVQ